ncbi:Putative acetyltransferase EpsM [Paenibacillus plantiphilus]|uniref:Acetyltransferase EpsM n=1 Tax=Paenibacillus plantiphilus TaxID=2905650 RepID=A0ABM9BTC7_9BACL|nr:acetyltransferase [Paenibacillus plantiphilus]CAH1192899.1 Putative acetyltransferase EpsM [Paenibacillus plantiphilus]
MGLPLVLLGAGGHAKVLLDIIRQTNNTILGVVAPEAVNIGVPYIGNDDQLVSQFPPDSVLLVNGIGSVGKISTRKAVFDSFKQQGYRFETLIHYSATVSASTKLSEGVQIMAGVIIQPGVTLGSNTIINTRSVVDHDCKLGEHVHISPGAILCGNVLIEPEVHIGAGATIIQSIRIRRGSIVGAGAVVISDVSSRSLVVGVPAKEINR